jgi:hypothetical protein
MAVYHMWATFHLERICSAIEQLPENIISNSPRQLGINDSGLSRDLASLLNGVPHAGGLKLSVAVRRDPRILQVQD